MPDDTPRRRRKKGVVARFRELPPWTQAWTAVLGLVIAGLGLAYQVFGDKAPSPTPIVIKPEAFISRVTFGDGQVEAFGGFRDVDVGAEVVLFIGRPAGQTDTRWLPIEATVTPDATATGDRVDGAWQALRPFTEGGQLSCFAIVVPAGSGAADGYEDIRENGPSSALVLAASPEFTAGE